MNLKEIEARLAAIAQELEQDGADVDALDQEARSLIAEKQKLEAQVEKRQKLIQDVMQHGQVIRTFTDHTEARKEYGVDSPEYRTAWLKSIAVDERGKAMFGPMTEEEQRAFTFLTTNSEALVPTQIANRIIELVRSQSPILADATTTLFTQGFGIPRHKSIDAGDAKMVNEGEANDDEQDTFDLLPLAGVEIKKHVELSRKMELQSIDAFENWLVDHLAARIRVGKEKHCLTRLDDPTYGIASGNVLTGTLSDEEVRKIFSQLDADGERVVYANNKTIWTVIAGLENAKGEKLFLPNAMSDPIVAGRLYGAAVKPDSNLADNVIYAGIKGNLLCNDFSPLEIVPDREPKTLKRIFTGYSLFDSGLENPLAFVKYTHSPG